MPDQFRVALLTNMVPPYHKPLYELLSTRFEMRFFISTPMEANRPWQPEWTGLDVVVQKCFTVPSKWKHPGGFGEPLVVHFPIDTLQQLGKFKPDAVISAEMGFRTLLSWLYVKLHRPCRLIVWSEVTGTTEQGRGTLRQSLRRFIAKRADGFIAVGPAGVRYIQSLGVRREKIFQIAYSTRLEPFLAIPLERSDDVARRLLFSGQLVERKGLAGFIHALIRWAESHPQSCVEFRLVGDGPCRKNLAALPLPANVKLIFIGTLQYQQLPASYAEAGIFVLPTLADTWGVVVNEALASGLPVLGSVQSQAVAQMVADGENGWTFSPDQPEQMYRALDRALGATDETLTGMRERARQRALQVTPEDTVAVCAEALLH